MEDRDENTILADENMAPAGKAGANKQYPSIGRQTISTVALLIAAILIAFLIKAFIVQPYIVDGESMMPTLHDGDRLIVDKVPRTLSRVDGHAYIPKRDQIIIFNQSNLPNYVGTKQLIKRVVGLPGDRVVVNNSKITIYNSAHPKGFNPDMADGYPVDAQITTGNIDLTLGPNQIFVCGDNRQNSEDSRYFGPVNVNNIVGKLVLRIMPFNQTKRF